MANATLEVMNSTLMNSTAPLTFISGTPGLFPGLERVMAASKDADSLASGFATVFDQEMVAIPAGMLLPRPPLNFKRRTETLVARIPLPPLVAMVVSNMLFVVLGVYLAFNAVMAIRTGHAVQDARVRLSNAGTVADCFEDPALGEDAKEEEELYAERRGLPTRRVAIVRREGGGRKFEQVDVSETDMLQK